MHSFMPSTRSWLRRDVSVHPGCDSKPPNGPVWSRHRMARHPSFPMIVYGASLAIVRKVLAGVAEQGRKVDWRPIGAWRGFLNVACRLGRRKMSGLREGDCALSDSTGH